jgi:hypothetical protein
MVEDQALFFPSLLELTKIDAFEGALSKPVVEEFLSAPLSEAGRVTDSVPDSSLLRQPAVTGLVSEAFEPGDDTGVPHVVDLATYKRCPAAPSFLYRT